MSKPLFQPEHFFYCFFESAYVFARSDIDGASGQTAGSIPSRWEPSVINSDFAKKYALLNSRGYGIHFTPNGVKDLDEKNRKHNLSRYNALFIDIDCPTTKEIKTADDKLDRENFKLGILNRLRTIPIKPSLTCETRNGYHIYWFLGDQPTADQFIWLQKRLSEELDGDQGALGALHSLRVPYSMYHKNGEKGFVLPVLEFSCFKYYVPNLFHEWLGTKQTYIKNAPVSVITYPSEHPFTNITSFPIKRVIEGLSGHALVNSDVFKLVPQFGGGKYNILVNGVRSPNWIDTKLNMVFSNNQTGFCNIFHFLNWYGHTNKFIYEKLKNMF